MNVDSRRRHSGCSAAVAGADKGGKESTLNKRELEVLLAPPILLAPPSVARPLLLPSIGLNPTAPFPLCLQWPSRAPSDPPCLLPQRWCSSAASWAPRPTTVLSSTSLRSTASPRAQE